MCIRDRIIAVAGGAMALAGVGVCGPVVTMIGSVASLVGMGGAPLMSIKMGEGDTAGARKILANCFVLICVFALVLMAVVIPLRQPMLLFFGASASTLPYADTYFLYYVTGTVFALLATGMNSFVTAQGFARKAMASVLLGAVMNIVLDLYFVRDLGMGVAGVAWATIMAQAVSGVLCLIRLVRMRDTVDINRHTLRLNGQLCRRLTALGLPAGITQAIFSLSAIVVQSLTNSLGTAVIATSVAVMRVDGFAMMPNFTFGTASTTYTGQNIGAGRLDRIHTGTRDLMKLALGVAGVLVLCILFFGGQLISLFTNTPTVIEMGIRGLRWLAFGYLAFAVSQVLQGVMRGVGETMTPMWISIVCTVLLRLPIAYLWAYLTRSPAWPNGHPDSIFASLLVSWTLNMLITLACFRLGRWRKKLAPQAADKA